MSAGSRLLRPITLQGLYIEILRANGVLRMTRSFLLAGRFAICIVHTREKL